jgi:tetratricopeptide (TPR) repeat protein
MYIKLFIFLISIILIDCKKFDSEVLDYPVAWKYSKIDRGEVIDFSPEKEFKEIKDLANLTDLIPGKKGYILLRGSFTYSKDIGMPLSISTGKITHSEETQLNGVFLGTNLRPNLTEWNFWNQYRVYPIPATAIRQGENFLYLKIYIEAEGFVGNSIQIGERADLERKIFFQMFYESYLNGIIAFLFLVISAYHLLIFLKRKKDRENLYYAVFALSFSIYSLNFISWFFSGISSMSYLVFQKIIFISMYISAYSIYRFISVFLKRNDKKWFFYFCVVVVVVPCFLTLIAPNYQFLYDIRGVTSLAIMPFLIYCLFIPVYNFIKYKNPEAKAMLLGLIIIFVSAIHDISNVVLKLHQPFWLGIGIPLFMASIMFLLGSKFVEVHNQTDDLNETLEQKVDERTKEVMEKMELIKALNIQQDGDYYLTSLIAKPLGTNFNKSKNIRTEFIIEQKKKFEFKNKSSELGGDICITGNLRFGDGKNRHVFFFNGDAMGKSMQGAGGAIVAGTVLNNILARSARNKKVIKITQAEWIKEVYHELDSVFSSFTGSMLMSCACGLIDERTKKMWYFNAEHPYTVLYRNGMASFIESAVELRKLGTVIEGNSFQLFEFQLEAGDVLFTGSDGRDDISINPKNEREINEDETLFLRQVEYNKGDLQKILDGLHKVGKFTDDLSLLKINIEDMPVEENPDEILVSKATDLIEAGNSDAALEILKLQLETDPNNLRILESVASIYYDKNNFLESIKFFEKIILIQPDDQEVLFNLSLAYKYLKDYKESILLSEKVLEKNPKKISNIINLADSYRLVGNFEKAKEVLSRITDTIPFFEKAMKLDRMLKSKMT